FSPVASSGTSSSGSPEFIAPANPGRGPRLIVILLRKRTSSLVIADDTSESLSSESARGSTKRNNSSKCLPTCLSKFVAGRISSWHNGQIDSFSGPYFNECVSSKW
ncbi:hypothetical protein T310_10222, partial [Rasamsonia emersonii CBS 393.64]